MCCAIFERLTTLRCYLSLAFYWGCDHFLVWWTVLMHKASRMLSCCLQGQIQLVFQFKFLQFGKLFLYNALQQLWAKKMFFTVAFWLRAFLGVTETYLLNCRRWIVELPLTFVGQQPSLIAMFLKSVWELYPGWGPFNGFDCEERKFQIDFQM